MLLFPFGGFNIKSNRLEGIILSRSVKAFAESLTILIRKQQIFDNYLLDAGYKLYMAASVRSDVRYL